MKFLCDNCKAKYQIPDEKVSGKTVRMKCRKCGHLIEVKSSVTTAGASGAASEPPEPGAPAPQASSAARPAPRPASLTTPRPGAPTPRPAPKVPAAPPAPRPSGTAPRPAPGTARGLAGAFKAELGEAKKPSNRPPPPTAPPPDEWFAGIHGSPVGPLTLAELRSKMAAPGVDEETLVWKEGMEEWVAVRTLPELATMLRDAKATRGSVRPAGPTPSPGPTAEVRPTTPTPSPASLGDPFAASSVPATPLAQASVPIPLVPATSTTSPVAAAEDEAPRPRRAAIPPAAWIAIVIALATGVVAGWVFSSKPPPPQPTVQVVAVTSETPAVQTPASATTAQGDAPDPGSAPSAKPATKVGSVGPVAKGDPNTKTPDTPPIANVPPMGNLPDPGGPTPGGPTPGGGAPLEQLSSADVQKVVNNGRNALKRACWEPALAAKPPSAPSSARVQVSMTIGRDGRVSRATPSGGEAFPTLGSCIASRVRAWVFPQAGTDTQTTAVFNFVAQQ